jgi:ATP-binding protein involved in chromosome partitioning
MNRQFRTYTQVTEPAGAEIPEQVEAQLERLQTRLAHIRNIIVIASGKGGVGKSFITTHLAASLAQSGQVTGVVDADLNGPSLASMLGAAREPLRIDQDGVHPARARNGCRVISTEMLLDSGDVPLRWNTPRGLEFLQQSLLETGMVRELVSDVAWGALDVLLIDLPPGTDKIARVAGLLSNISLMLMITTPSRATERVVARSLTQARQLGIAQVGVVINMDSFICPHCQQSTSLFGTHHDLPASSPTLQFSSPIWARVPFEPSAADVTDSGGALDPASPTTHALGALAARVLNALL